MENQNMIAGNKRVAARFISRIENKDTDAIETLKSLYTYTGGSYVIGITGPPGAGKSTLTDKLAKAVRAKGKTVGIIAIDPTSPFTGGAILGDRVRMNDLATDSGVFIRSMGARGYLGGISEATSGAVKILDLYGCDYIFIETVGVGQSEVDIVKTSDTVVMVTVPGLGDDIQAIKAGIMEIGDVFAVNKADRDGAPRAAREIEIMLDFNHKDWRPPVKQVIAATNTGVAELLEAIENHRSYMVDSGEGQARRIENAKSELLELVKQRIMSRLLSPTEQGQLVLELAKRVALREENPYSAAEAITKALL